MKKYLMDLWRSLFPHAQAVRWILSGFVLAIIAAWATTCRGSELAFEGGVQYLRGPAATIAVNVIVPGPKDASVEAGLFLVGLAPSGQTGVMGGQVLVVDGFGKFDLGIGLAYMNREHEQLGTQLNFALLARYWFADNWYVTLRHFSNAGTTQENVGIDLLLVGKRF
jgi:hypothetical protein